MNKHKNSRGAALAEYVVLMGVVGGLAIFAITSFGASVDVAYDTIDTSVSDKIDEVLDPTGPGDGGGSGDPTSPGPTGPLVVRLTLSTGVQCWNGFSVNIQSLAERAIANALIGEVSWPEQGYQYVHFHEPSRPTPHIIDWYAENVRFMDSAFINQPDADEYFYDYKDHYPSGTDWSNVPFVLNGIVDPEDGSVYEAVISSDFRVLNYNMNGGYNGWVSNSGSSTCFEGGAAPVIYNLEGTHPNGTMMELSIQVGGLGGPAHWVDEP